MNRKKCKGCPNENEPVCCSSRPNKLSTAYNYFVKPMKASKHKPLNATLVVGKRRNPYFNHANWGNC